MQSLRSARLRPTMSRMAVLRLIETRAPAWLSAEEIFRVLLQDGHSIGLGTIYRVLQELLAAELLMRKWGLHRKAFYRSPREESVVPVLLLICPLRDRAVELRDDELLARLVAAALQQGIDLADHSLSIRAEAPGASGTGPDDLADRRDNAGQRRTGAVRAQRASSSSPGQSRM